MKKVIKGKLYNTDSALSVCCRNVPVKFPAGEYGIEMKLDLRLELYRSVVIKPGLTFEGAYNADLYPRWREEMVDFRKGDFFLVASVGYSTETPRAMTDEEAQEFMDSCDCPVDTWTKYFGTGSDDVAGDFVNLKRQIQSKDWTIESNQKTIDSKNARIRELEEQLKAARTLVAGANHDEDPED